MKQQLRKRNQLLQCEKLFYINTSHRDLEMGKPFPAYTLLYVRLNPSSHVFGIFKQQTLKQDNRACMGEGQHVCEKKIFFQFKDFKAELLRSIFSPKHYLLSTVFCLCFFSSQYWIPLLSSVVGNNCYKTCHQTSQEQTFRTTSINKQIQLQHPADFATESQNS